MGMCVSKQERKVVLVMVGLDNAGKTSTVKGIVGQIPTDVAPTLGFASFKVNHNKFNITIYDVGGGKQIRGIWRNYLAEAFGFIFVVDASDSNRLAECQEVLHTLLKTPAVSGKPFLILANKQDINGALDELEISQILDIEAIVNEVRCRTRVEAITAIKGSRKKLDSGISIGFRWLLNTIDQDYNRLQEKITKDVAIQQEYEEGERLLREERLKQMRKERETKEADNFIETCMVKEDPFRPLTVIVKEINDKESKQGENANPLTNSESRNSASANSSNGLKTDTKFEKKEHVQPEKTLSDYELFEIVGPPGSIPSDSEFKHKAISRQSTIDESDDVMTSPSRILSSEQRQPKKKKLFRRKNRTAPLPPVSLTLSCDLPPLNPIAKQITEEEQN